jgi:hypothetical protein
VKSRAELESRLSVTRDWLDENENSGASEVGIELGWEQALEWVLGQM